MRYRENSAPPQSSPCDVGGDGPMILLKRDGTAHDVKHPLSCPNNKKTKQAYINHEDQFKAFCKSHKCQVYNKPKEVYNF
eukprot:15330653-Ditylum_brightwellii.AAC.1